MIRSWKDWKALSHAENTFSLEAKNRQRQKGWIHEDTRIGPVLEVAVCYHQGCHGLEIRIQSLSEDGTRSWVRVRIGINKYVTEISEILPSPRITDGACSGKPGAGLRPNQMSLKWSSSRSKVQTEKTIHERKMIDVQQGEYDAFFLTSQRR